MVRLDDDFEMVLADVPGLIAGASEGRGLGHRFLRHVERARVLLVLIDLCDLAEHEPAEQLDVLLTELGRYRPELLQRRRLVVGSRADTAPGASFGFGAGRLSSAASEGVNEVLGELARLVVEARCDEPAAEAPVVHRPLPAATEVTVSRVDAGVWEVSGRAALRSVALSDLTDPGALAYAQDRLRSLGVERVLARAGAAFGDEVRVGGFSFTYADDADAGVEAGEPVRGRTR